MWAAQYVDFIRPRTFLTSGSMGTMGFGLPAAIGAQLANPGALVIDVDGDGSIRMNLGELETLTTYDIPVKVSAAQQPRRRHGAPVAGSVLRQPLLGLGQDAAQEGLRQSGRGRRLRLCQARRDCSAEVRPMLDEFVNFPGPAFLEVMVDPTAHVYPMVGPGMGYKDMITGKWIPSREQGAEEDRGAGTSSSEPAQRCRLPLRCEHSGGQQLSRARRDGLSARLADSLGAAQPCLEIQERLRARRPRRLPLFLNGRPPHRRRIRRAAR